MAITILSPSAQYSQGQLPKLATTLTLPPNPKVLQVLTRFDFQNRRFANLKLLHDAVKDELDPPVFAWAKNLTPYEVVEKAVEGNFVTNVVLVRGASVESATKALKAKTAGGEAANFGLARPSEEEAISQVGGSRPGVQQVKLPEFTTEIALADKWAQRGGFLFIKISAVYLTKGDVGQKGWVAHFSAPIMDGHFEPHPKPLAFKVPNAD